VAGVLATRLQLPQDGQRRATGSADGREGGNCQARGRERGYHGEVGPPTSADCLEKFGIACYSPLQVERAYGLPGLYAKGFNGKGRTIVIVDPFGSPTIRHDLHVFDKAFGCAPRLHSGYCSQSAR
jgi:hypothetical protein